MVPKHDTRPRIERSLFINNLKGHSCERVHCPFEGSGNGPLAETSMSRDPEDD